MNQFRRPLHRGKEVECDMTGRSVTTKPSSLSGHRQAGEACWAIESSLNQTAHRMHLGSSSFDLAPQTLSVWGVKVSFFFGGGTASLKVFYMGL